MHCSYVWRGGRCLRVPASRADVFKDRSLSPADKRALMRFLQNAQAAAAGQGPLLVSAVPRRAAAACCSSMR
jgi:RAB protein geranylgeranyltransferase component A